MLGVAFKLRHHPPTHPPTSLISFAYLSAMRAAAVSAVALALALAFASPLASESSFPAFASGFAPGDFVGTSGGNFTQSGGRPFFFVSTNTYYLFYQPQYMVEDVFQRCARFNISVLRTWAFNPIGHPDGSGTINGGGPKNGVWFQAFDNKTGAVVVNSDAQTGLGRLDLVVALAARYGVRLILTLANNWVDFQGMDQYVAWLQWANASYGPPYHDDFYAHPQARVWFKEYVLALTSRVNTITGVAYKDEPAIMAWELANEPRCQGTHFPTTKDCVTDYAVYGKWPQSARILPWVAEMSAYVKQAAPNQLVAVGDEGFLCESYQMCGQQTCDCYAGTDFGNITALPTVDFASLHLYPRNWGEANMPWGAQWIANHTAYARSLGKPTLVGEFGVSVGEGQSSVYAQWISAANAAQTGGVGFWMLCGRENDASGDRGWYPSYDGLCVYMPVNSSEPSPPSGDPATAGVLASAAAARAAGDLGWRAGPELW
jgi:mannan endo-1,4-beta-mannosidase